MWIAFTLALPRSALVSTVYDDAKCPRRDCPANTLMPQFGANKLGLLDERFGVPIYVKDTSKSPARFG